MISWDNQKSKQNKKKEVEKIVASKDEEITRLKNHSQDLIAHIKKLKREKYCKKKYKRNSTKRKWISIMNSIRIY